MKKIIKDIQNRNFGDAIHKITTATKIKTVVDVISDATGLDCGCETRRERWNLGKKDDNQQTTKTGF